MAIFSSSMHRDTKPDKVDNKSIAKINTIDQTTIVNGQETVKKDGDVGSVPTEGTVNTGENAGKPVEIVVNGPLGHVYTQALNLLLGKEDMASLNLAEIAGNADSGQDTGVYVVTDNTVDGVAVEPEDKAYVYVTDASGMNQGEMNRVLDEIDVFTKKNPGAEVVVGLENARHASKYADRMISLLSLSKARVMVSKGSTLEHVGSWVKQHQKGRV